MSFARKHVRALFVLAALAFVAYVLVVISLQEREPVGNPAVFARISSLTDCAALQDEFDVADGNRRFGADNRAQLAYMDAADERMRELGCYG